MRGLLASRPYGCASSGSAKVRLSKVRKLGEAGGMAVAVLDMAELQPRRCRGSRGESRAREAWWRCASASRAALLVVVSTWCRSAWEDTNADAVDENAIPARVLDTALQETQHSHLRHEVAREQATALYPGRRRQIASNAAKAQTDLYHQLPPRSASSTSPTVGAPTSPTTPRPVRAAPAPTPKPLANASPRDSGVPQVLGTKDVDGADDVTVGRRWSCRGAPPGPQNADSGRPGASDADEVLVAPTAVAAEELGPPAPAMAITPSQDDDQQTASDEESDEEFRELQRVAKNLKQKNEIMEAHEAARASIIRAQQDFS